MKTTAELLALRAKVLWRFLQAQNLAFEAMCFYLFIEYVRPQQLIPSLGSIPFGYITLGVAGLAFLGSGRWFQLKGFGTWLLLLYTVVIVVSSFTAYDRQESFDQWQLWASWLTIFFLIINVVDTEQRMVLYALLWLLFNYYMSQGAAKQFVLRGFRFASWGVRGAPGWFQNSGEFGIEMCIFLPLAWHYYLASKPYVTKWRKLFLIGMPVTAILGIVGSSSRGALVGLAGVGLWALARTKYFFRTVAGVVVLGALTWFITPAEQKQRWSESGEDSTSTRRMTYWRAGIDMTRRYPALGVGYGNWIEYYGDHYVDAAARRGSIGIVQLSHNIFIQCMAELGLVGLSVLLMMMTATFVINHRTRKLARAGPGPPRDFTLQMAYGLDGALIGFIGSGFFVTVLYYPFFWINLAFTVALHDIARRDRRRARAPALSLGGAPAPPIVPAVAPSAVPRVRGP